MVAAADIEWVNIRDGVLAGTVSDLEVRTKCPVCRCSARATHRTVYGKRPGKRFHHHVYECGSMLFHDGLYFHGSRCTRREWD